MGTKKEISQLFQKFADKTIEAKEWDKFNTCVNNQENDRHLARLLSELWDYTAMSNIVNSRDSS